MFAVILTGGKQYRVSAGDILNIEKLDADIGAQIEFDKVLLINNETDTKIGSPYVDNAKVKAEVLSHDRGEKIRIVKFRRRKHFLKQAGHRQDYTQVKITDITN
jgi:large subunit ribosomal protein L21